MTGMASGMKASKCRLIARPDPDRDDIAVAEVEEDQPHALVLARRRVPGLRYGDDRSLSVRIALARRRPRGIESEVEPSGRDDRRS